MVPQTSVRLKVLLVLAATALVRLAIAARMPLFPDEAYYWEWSRRLAFGYFDHPPLVAYLIRIGTAVFGDTPLGVRAGAVVAGIIGTWFMVQSARRLAGERAALFAAVIFALMPLSAAGLVMATPDAGLLASIAATLYCVVRALETPSSSARSALLWWAAAGAAQGLAFHAKYTAILIPMGLAIALISRADVRQELKQPGPYVAVLAATLVFLPVLLWNARHDWVSFTFQLQHGFTRAGGSVLQREMELIGGQIGLVSPILFAMMGVAVGRGALGKSQPRTVFLLSLVSIFALAFFAYSATKRRAEANWPAIAWLPAALVLLAHARSVRWDRWLNAAVAVAAALTGVVYVNSLTPVLPIAATRDPVARAAGWVDVARAVEGDLPALPLSPHRFVGSNRYQEASELAFHMTGRPRTVALNVSSRPNQYDLWPSFDDRATAGDTLVLLLDDVDHPDPAIVALTPHFATVTPVRQVVRTRSGQPLGRYRVWQLAGWRGTWPSPPIRSAP